MRLKSPISRQSCREKSRVPMLGYRAPLIEGNDSTDTVRIAPRRKKTIRKDDEDEEVGGE